LTAHIQFVRPFRDSEYSFVRLLAGGQIEDESKIKWVRPYN